MHGVNTNKIDWERGLMSKGKMMIPGGRERKLLEGHQRGGGKMEGHGGKHGQ